MRTHMKYRPDRQILQHTDRQKDGAVFGKQITGCSNTKTDRETGPLFANRTQPDSQTARQTDRQTDRQTTQTTVTVTHSPLA